MIAWPALLTLTGLPDQATLSTVKLAVPPGKRTPGVARATPGTMVAVIVTGWPKTGLAGELPMLMLVAFRSTVWMNVGVKLESPKLLPSPLNFTSSVCGPTAHEKP